MLSRIFLFSKIVFLWIIINSEVKSQIFVDSTPHFKVVRLAEGVFACIHVFGGEGICNSGIIDMGDYTVVIDPFMTPVAAEGILKWIANHKLPPVKYVINTHYHNDHVRGNQVFDKDVKIIASKITAELIASEEPKAIEAESNYAPGYCNRFTQMKSGFQGDTLERGFLVLKMMQPYFCALARSKSEIVTRVPDVTFEKKIVLGSGKKLEIMEMGAGHTPSDVVVYLPHEQVLFAADLVTGDFHPYLPDGNPESWTEILGEMSKWAIKWIVPGHGEVGQKNMIPSTSKYISEVLAAAERLDLNTDVKSEDFTPEIPESFRYWWLEQFYSDNIKFAFSRRAGRNSQPK